MSICTATEVFNRMDTPADQRTNKATSIIEPLIDQVQTEIERVIGRKITLQTANDLVLVDGVNCKICGVNLYLTGIYRDIVSISSVYELGTSISAFSYSGSTGYVLNKRVGALVRVNQCWSEITGAIKISGTFGLVADDTTANLDIKKIAIEMVAAKSGLWRYSYLTEGGSVEATRVDIPKATQDALKKYIAYDIF